MFRDAPRRFWIAARLIAEYGLEPSEATLAEAERALPVVGERLPLAAPARRALSRILAVPTPAAALDWLHRTGVTRTLAPGARAANGARVEALPAIPSLRFAAWLRGAATASVMVRLRMPHGLARRVERVQSAHPIERSWANGRDATLRKLRARLSPEELAGLVAWRRLELEEAGESQETRAVARQLVEIEARLEALRRGDDQAGRMRTLALDGRAVMERLGSGPGPHVGRALAHLARHVEAHPEDNEPERLARVLIAWSEDSGIG